MKPKVAVVKSDTYNTSSVYKSVKESVDLLGGAEKFIKPGMRVLLKPNLLSAKSPEEAVTTHPVIVEAVIQLVRESGGTPYIGDSPPLGSWDRIITKTGMKEVALRTGTEIIQFLDSKAIDRQGKHTFKRLEVSEEVKKADVIINLPKLKTHSLTKMTLAVKNIFGCVVGKRKAQWHLNAGTDDMFFARMLVELYEEVSPHLTILDGIYGMEGNGPSGGTPKKIGVIVSGTDCVAIDTVICNIVKKKWDYLYTNRAAREKGIGETDIEQIEICGRSIKEVEISDFKFPATFDFGATGYFFKRQLQNLFTNKPKEDRDLCTLCGFCIEACPPKVITKKNGHLQFDYDHCIRCFCCHEVCPEKAMQIKKGLGVRFISG